MVWLRPMLRLCAWLGAKEAPCSAASEQALKIDRQISIIERDGSELPQAGSAALHGFRLGYDHVDAQYSGRPMPRRTT
jgi:hypothetical protein